MNSEQRKTLEAIFSSPVPANIEWKKIESLFLALGATIVEGSGLRVSFILEDEKLIFTGHIQEKKPSDIK